MLHFRRVHKRASPVSTLVVPRRSTIECHNSKHSGAYQQGYGKTADDRKNGMPALGRLRVRGIGILRRCDTNPEFMHGDDTSMPVHFRADVSCVERLSVGSAQPRAGRHGMWSGQYLPAGSAMAFATAVRSVTTAQARAHAAFMNCFSS
jgi:hypothetical protein